MDIMLSEFSKVINFNKYIKINANTIPVMQDNKVRKKVSSRKQVFTSFFCIPIDRIVPISLVLSFMDIRSVFTTPIRIIKIKQEPRLQL